MTLKLLALHKTIKKVEEDTAGMYFNTAISQMMIFVNEATGTKTVPHETLLAFLQVVARGLDRYRTG